MMDIGGLVYAFFNSAGPGGVVVLSVIGLATTVYVLLTRWILHGGDGEQNPAPGPQRFPRLPRK
nr:hypothetical protein [Chloroflexota bacterium]